MGGSKVVLGIALAVAAAGGGWWIGAAAQDDRRIWESQDGLAYVRLPEFVWKALSSPSARKAGLWTGSEGEILRYTVHVDRTMMPDWIHAMADARIGKGEDVEYELEVYPDGSQVYEIYRVIDGLEKQLSVRADRSLYYIGVEHPPDRLPEAVASALRDLKDLRVDKCVLKEGPGVAEYHLKATRDGMPCRVRVSKQGKVIAVQRKLGAEIEVPVTR